MRLFLLLLAILAIPIASFAASDKGAQLVLKTTQGKATISQEFHATANINGYVIKPTQGGQSLVVYADKNGRYMFVGNLVNSAGKSLTSQFMDKYVNSKTAKDSYAEASKMYYFSEGSNKAPHKVYIIIDPNCIFCHKLYAEIYPLIDKGDVQVRWIAAGFLKQSSAGKSAALLKAGSDKKAAALLRKDELKFNTGQEEGGITPLKDTSANKTAFAHVKANTDFFSKYGFQGTPTMLYKDASGKPHYFPGYVGGAELKNLVNTMGSSW